MKSTTFAVLRYLRPGLVITLLCASGLIHAQSFTGGQPVSPQPEPSSLNPGLAVSYFYDYFNHIDELDGRQNGQPGTALENLDHVSFEDGKVLTTDRPMGVGAHIRGLIHLDQAGEYTFTLQSNDGVKLTIGGVLLHTDPEIHAARWSPELVYAVQTPGWYEFVLDYYQRKGTAALRLRWVPPGGEEEIVPPTAFAHP
jgi:hypothetical protein